MKKLKSLKFIIIVIVITLGVFIYLQLSKDKITFQNITGDMAIVELQKDDSIILLDVRTKEEHDKKRIPNSILIPVDDLRNIVLNEIEDKQTRIFVYCGSGARSRRASRILTNLGYENVYNLGGINDWKYETENET